MCNYTSDDINPPSTKTSKQVVIVGQIKNFSVETLSSYPKFK